MICIVPRQNAPPAGGCLLLCFPQARRWYNPLRRVRGWKLRCLRGDDVRPKRLSSRHIFCGTNRHSLRRRRTGVSRLCQVDECCWEDTPSCIVAQPLPKPPLPPLSPRAHYAATMHTSCRRFNCILNFTAFELCNHRYASFFRLYFAGYTSRDIPNGASAAEFQAALMSITQDQAISSADGGADPVHVTVSLDAVVSPIVAWRVTFLSHLEVTEAESRSGGNARFGISWV